MDTDETEPWASMPWKSLGNASRSEYRGLGLPLNLPYPKGLMRMILSTLHRERLIEVFLDDDEASELQSVGWLTPVHINGRGNRYPHHRIIQRREHGIYTLAKGTLARRLSAFSMVKEARAKGLRSCPSKGYRVRPHDGNPLNLALNNRKIEWINHGSSQLPFRNSYWDVAEAWRLMRLIDEGIDPRERTKQQYLEQLANDRTKAVSNGT